MITSLNSLRWEKDGLYQDGPSIWSARASGFAVAKVLDYREYTSSAVLVRIVEGLCSLTGGNCISATFTGDREQDFQWKACEINALGAEFAKTSWGVWTIAIGPTPPKTSDIIDFFKFLTPSQCGVFLDIDGGMIIACPVGILGEAARQGELLPENWTGGLISKDT